MKLSRDDFEVSADKCRVVGENRDSSVRVRACVCVAVDKCCSFIPNRKYQAHVDVSGHGATSFESSRGGPD